MSNRREFMLGALMASVSAGVAQADDDSSPGAAPRPESKGKPLGWSGSEVVAILVYPGFTALDVFGPHHFLISMSGARIHLVGETGEPVRTDSGVLIHPTKSFDDCPDEVTILLVPGGTLGTLAAARSRSVRDFLRSRAAHADWIASVCTGSLILGAAGLLQGYQATSHWLVRDQLALFGAAPVDRRVVVDRNRVTGAGVTAGLDFGLTLVEKQRGREYAEAVQLFSEYDPQPPLASGSEDKADPETVAMLRKMHGAFHTMVAAVARDVAEGSRD